MYQGKGKNKALKTVNKDGTLHNFFYIKTFKNLKPKQTDPLLVVLVLELRHGRAGHGDHRDRGQRRPPHAHR